MCQSKSRCNVVLSFLLPMKLICPALIKCVEHPPVLYFFICDSSLTRVANILSDSSLIRTRPSQKCLTLGGLCEALMLIWLPGGQGCHFSFRLILKCIFVRKILDEIFFRGKHLQLNKHLILPVPVKYQAKSVIQSDIIFSGHSVYFSSQ